MYTIVSKISKLRSKNKITQEELAIAVDVSRQTIIAIEKGNYVPSLLLALRISKFFSKPVEKLFDIKEFK